MICEDCEWGKFDPGDPCEFWGYHTNTGDEWYCTHERFGEQDGCPLDWPDEEEEECEPCSA